jgi:hypothetical protein
MSKITQVQQDNETRRILVYIDYRFCASIRPDVWDAMELKDGDEITCSQLHQKEKAVYNKYEKRDRNYSNKQALKRIVRWFDKYIATLDAKIIDFKFNNYEFDYPSYRHDQNISLFIRGTNTELITLEVTTSEIQRGSHHWVNADKIVYAQSQSKRDGWVVLYYKYPVEKLIWIKPQPKIIYKTEEVIKGLKRPFVFFKNDSSEIYSSPKFFEYIQAKIDSKVSEISSRVITASPLIKDNTSDGVVFPQPSLTTHISETISNVPPITKNNDAE